MAQLRLVYANKKINNSEGLSTVGEGVETNNKPRDLISTVKLSEHLHTSSSTSSMNSSDSNISKFDRAQLEDMSTEDLTDMLIESTILDEQASVIHFLWMKM